MKRILIWFPAICVLICGGAAAGLLWLEHRYLPARLAEASFLGQPVRVEGKPELFLLPPAVAVGQLSWHGRVSGFDIAFSARSVRITPDVLSFMGSQPELEELALEKPDARIIRKNAEAKGDAAAGGSEAGWELGIGRIVIQEGSVSYADASTDIQLTHLRLTGENARPKQVMNLQSDFGLRFAERDGMALRGNFAIKTQARYYAPHLTFRSGSATFTVLSPETLKLFSPCRARFDGAVNLETLEARVGASSVDTPLGRMEAEGEMSDGAFAGKGRLDIEMGSLSSMQGNLAIDSPFIYKNNQLQLRGAEIGFGEFQVAADADVLFADKGRQLALNGQWAEGAVTLNLDAQNGARSLLIKGRRISLGEVLRQLGVRGFSGGPMSLDVSVAFAGRDIGAMKKSARGGGKIECGRLELEPFGEVSMLLPLLGGSGRSLPGVMDNFRAGINIVDGKIAFAPITGTGPEFSLKGEVGIDMLTDNLKGELVFNLLGLRLPVVFSGPLGRPEFRIAPGAPRQ